MLKSIVTARPGTMAGQRWWRSAAAPGATGATVAPLSQHPGSHLKIKIHSQLGVDKTHRLECSRHKHTPDHYYGPKGVLTRQAERHALPMRVHHVVTLWVFLSFGRCLRCLASSPAHSASPDSILPSPHADLAPLWCISSLAPQSLCISRLYVP